LIIGAMREMHRLSYVGDPSLVSDFVRVLREEGVVTHEELVTIAEQIGRDPGHGEPLSILVSGGYGVTASSISRAISKFADEFPGRAQVRDDGSMPTSHDLAYIGNPALIETFIAMLSGEAVEVSEPEEDDDWPSVSEQLSRSDAKVAAITIHLIGSGDINAGIQAAISKFHQRFPDQARVCDADQGT
jgi:hypothetical protein